MEKYDLLYIYYQFILTNLTNIVQIHHEYTRKHKKSSKFGMCQINGDVVVVCNHTNAYIMINQHYIGT